LHKHRLRTKRRSDTVGGSLPTDGGAVEPGATGLLPAVGPVVYNHAEGMRVMIMLEQELATFDRELPKLLHTMKGQFVLLHGDEIHSSYKSENEAYTALTPCPARVPPGGCPPGQGAPRG
jgi:hypothetical protein